MGAKRLLVFLELEWDTQLGGKNLRGSTSFCLRQRSKMSPLEEGPKIPVLCEGGRASDGLGRLSDDQSRRERNKSQEWAQGPGL